MQASDGNKVSEHGHVTPISPEEGEKIAREAAEYRERNKEKEQRDELERRARYGRKEG